MWVWVNSGSWWRTGRPGVLQFMGSQRVGHDWVTELNWTEESWTCFCLLSIPALKFYDSFAFILEGCINNIASQPGISWPTSKHLRVYLKDWKSLKFVAIIFVCVFLSLGAQIHFTDCCCCSVTQSCPTLCDPKDCSMPGLSVPHYLPKFAQVHMHCIGDAIQPSHPLMLFSPSALNLSQHQGLF